jgi:DNA-binding MarR family transcriptional regulator
VVVVDGESFLRYLKLFCRKVDIAVLKPAERAAAKWGLPEAQLAALRFVHRNQGCLLGDVATALGISPPAATRLIDRLEEKGLVDRGLKEGDRRAFSLTVSPEGERAAASIDAIEGRAVEELLGSLTKEERRLVWRAMELVIAADEMAPEGLCLHCGDAHDPTCIVERLTD